MQRVIRTLLALAALLGVAVAWAPAQAPPQFKTGRRAPTLGQFQALRATALVSHADLFDGLSDAKEPKWDSREKGWVGPVKNQGNCGSCWLFSGNFLVEVAYVKAGLGKAGEFNLSEQFTLSCYENGGCDGDDNTTVLKHAKRLGLPLTKDYGPYHARETPCRSGTFLMHPITDWTFADGEAGYEQVGRVQKIKNGIKHFGAVGCAIAADDRFMNVRPGQVFRGNNGQINHDVALVGWDDEKGRSVGAETAWVLRNSWGTDWCDGGYCWIAAGANRVGTEPVVAYVKPVEPPPPPPAPPAPEVGHRVRVALAAGLGVLLGVLLAVILAALRRRFIA